MEIKLITNPNKEISQNVLDFQLNFMGWSKEELKIQDDKYGSIPFGYVIGYINNKIISVINLHKRNIKFNNQNILLGGIGGVCTHKDYRRKGLSSQLLKIAMKALKKEKCDIAFLCTDIKNLSKLYTQIGFTPLNREYQSIGKSKKIYSEDDGMIAPVCSKKLFLEILKDKNTFNLQGQNW